MPGLAGCLRLDIVRANPESEKVDVFGAFEADSRNIGIQIERAE
jgi:hypothetical protein